MKRFLASLGLIAVVPFFMSRRSRVFQVAWIDAHPAGVFPFINDLRNWPLWTDWINPQSVIGRYEENYEADTGEVQHRAVTCTEGTVKIISSVQDRSVSFLLEIQDSQRQMEGTLTLESVGEGTRVTWACWWLGDTNPYARYLDLALRFWTSRDFRVGLRNLKELVESCRKWETV